MARKKPWKPAGDKSEIVAAIPAACSDETLAFEFMERQRWNERDEEPQTAHSDSNADLESRERQVDRVAAEAVWPRPYDGGGRPVARHGCASGAKRANRSDEQANSHENHTRPDRRTDRMPHQRQRPSELKQ